MSTRSFTARQALTGLLVAVSLPFLAVAKPPGLPVRVLVDCQTPAVQDKGGGAPYGLDFNWDADPSGVKVLYAPGCRDIIGTFCPGIEDTLESYWRTVTRWVPVTCMPGFGAEQTTRLAVIEILPNAPKLQDERSVSEDLRQIEYEWERIWADPSQVPSQTSRWRTAGDGCILLEYLHMPALTSDLPELLPPPWVGEITSLSLKSVTENATERASPADEAKPEKRSFWPRIEIKLTIEVKQP